MEKLVSLRTVLICQVYTDSMECNPQTETSTHEVEEVLPDGSIGKKNVFRTSTRQVVYLLSIYFLFFSF